MKLETIDLMFGDVRKKSNVFPKSISTNIIFTSVKEDKNRLNIDFEYTASYVPDGSQIRVGGKAIFSGSESKVVADQWSKSGKITGVPGELIMNAINYAGSINGVLLAHAFNLTAPVVLATIALEEKKK